MIIVLVLVALWGVVLGPSFIRKIRISSSDRSISSFHRSLDLLERSGPKVVEPAYRLAGTGNALPIPQIARPPASARAVRPTLVLLGPQGQRGEVPMNDRYGDYFDEYEQFDEGYAQEYPEYEAYPERRIGVGASIPSGVLSRREAALRRRNILLGLLASAFLTVIMGFFMSFFFYLTILAVVALVAYVALMAYAATHGMVGEKGYERHVAHGEAHLNAERYVDPYYEDYDERYEEHYVAPVASTRSPRVEILDDGWWDQHQRAAAR
jgi:hypothetical protein